MMLVFQSKQNLNYNFYVQVLENILHEVWGENFMGMKQTINAKMEAN